MLCPVLQCPSQSAFLTHWTHTIRGFTPFFVCILSDTVAPNAVSHSAAAASAAAAAAHAWCQSLYVADGGTTAAASNPNTFNACTVGTTASSATVP